MSQAWLPPQEGSISPLAYFSALVADDAQLPLFEAAMALGQCEEPVLDIEQALTQVDAWVVRLRRRLPADASALHRLHCLNHFFYEEMRFGPNVNHFHDPANSYLHRVLETRRGIPISLAVLWMEIAEQIGLPAWGVSFPGHFLMKLSLPAGDVVLDPLDGISLSVPVLVQRLEPYREQFGWVGDLAPRLGEQLRPASKREILARMLGNLKAIHQTAGDAAACLPVQERLVLLWPARPQERRDRAEILAALGRAADAAADWRAYLSQAPDAPDAAIIRQRLSSLPGR